LSLVFAVQSLAVTGALTAMPASYTAFADSFKVFTLQMDFPGSINEYADDDDDGSSRRRRRLLSAGGSGGGKKRGSTGLNATSSNTTSSEKALARDVDINNALTGNLFYASIAMVVAIVFHMLILLWLRYMKWSVPPLLHWPQIEISVFRLLQMGLLTTCMAVIFHTYQSASLENVLVQVAAYVVLLLLIALNVCVARAIYSSIKYRGVNFEFQAVVTHKKSSRKLGQAAKPTPTARAPSPKFELRGMKEASCWEKLKTFIVKTSTTLGNWKATQDDPKAAQIIAVWGPLFTPFRPRARYYLIAYSVRQLIEATILSSMALFPETQIYLLCLVMLGWSIYVIVGLPYLLIGRNLRELVFSTFRVVAFFVITWTFWGWADRFDAATAAMMLQLSGLLAYILPALYDLGLSICDSFDTFYNACWCTCCLSPPRINLDAALTTFEDTLNQYLDMDLDLSFLTVDNRGMVVGPKALELMSLMLRYIGIFLSDVLKDMGERYYTGYNQARERMEDDQMLAGQSGSVIGACFVAMGLTKDIGLHNAAIQYLLKSLIAGHHGGHETFKGLLERKAMEYLQSDIVKDIERQIEEDELLKQVPGLAAAIVTGLGLALPTLVATMLTPLIRRRIEPYYTLSKSDRQLKDCALEEEVEWSGVAAPGAAKAGTPKIETLEVCDGGDGSQSTPVTMLSATIKSARSLFFDINLSFSDGRNSESRAASGRTWGMTSPMKGEGASNPLAAAAVNDEESGAEMVDISSPLPSLPMPGEEGAPITPTPNSSQLVSAEGASAAL